MEIINECYDMEFLNDLKKQPLEKIPKLLNDMTL